MSWRKVKLGEILTESKIESLNPSAENRLRVKLNAAGVEKRPLIAEAEGATKYFIRKAGQFIYGKQNLHKGAFGIIPGALDGFESSSDLPAFDIDESCKPEWLDYYLKQGNFYQTLVEIAKGAATKRIQPEKLYQVEIPLPELDEQEQILSSIIRAENNVYPFFSEIAHQKTLLNQLKKAILQEAIEGKLTADWRAANPDAEPASQLLQRIKAEKEKLIKEKKIKKEKPLPPISETEIPFPLPEGWVWCRLGEIIGSLQYGTSQKCSYDSTQNTPILRIPNVSTGELSITDLKYTDLSVKEKNQYSLEEGDLLLVRSNGSREIVGSCVHIPFGYESFGYAGYLIRLRFVNNLINTEFIQKYFRSSTLREQIETPLRTTVGINNINTTEISNLIVALPPLAEQKAIVAKVEALMEKCRLLETEIAQSEQHANQLMQAVLKEAFAPAPQMAEAELA